MLVPEAWDGNPELDQELRDYYRYHSLLVEPWDGPAGLIFTDGRVVGAALDRKRSTAASLCGLFRRPHRLLLRGGRVDLSGAGRCAAAGSARADDRRRSRARASRRTARSSGGSPRGAVRALARRGPAPRLERTPVEPPDGDLTARQAASATRARTSTSSCGRRRPRHEPTSSMGDDTALPPLAGRARPLYSVLRQRFAQVTNPPIDHLRERHTFSLRCILGGRRLC
jgi:hypothetical protein